MHSFYKRTPSGRPPQPHLARQKYFTKPELFLPKSLIVFTIRAEKVCYKLANMRYKLCNAYYKLCNAYYKLCNKKYHIWQ